MSYQSQYDREETLLYEQYDRGELTSAELTRELNELARDYRAAAQDAAWDAYEAELDRW
jgi:hypothetical protein